MALNAKQKAFVREYLKDCNATQAALRAGYARASAHSQAHDLLKKPEIKIALGKSVEKAVAKVELTVEEVVAAMKRMINVDMRRIYDSEGRMLPPQQWPDDIALAVAGVETVERQQNVRRSKDPDEGEDQLVREFEMVRKVKLSDRNAAITNGMRYLGMFRDKLELTGNLVVQAAVGDESL